MLVYDPIQLLDVETGVPGSLRIDHGDTSLLADAETVDLAAQDGAHSGWNRVGLNGQVTLPLGRCARGIQLFESTLEVGPQCVRFFTRCAFVIGLVGTQEYVPLCPRNAQGIGDAGEALVWTHDIEVTPGLGLALSRLKVGGALDPQ